MECIRPSIDETQARGRFERRRFGDRLRRLLYYVSAFSPRSIDGISKELPHLEQVWLPHYLVEVSVDHGGRMREVSVLVGGHDPHAAIVARNRIALEERPLEESFAPRLTPEEAIDAARQAVVKALSQRGRWRATLELAAAPRVVQHPYWAYYFARRGGRLDVRLLDAVTGQPTGPKVKAALLAALADRRSQKIETTRIATTKDTKITKGALQNS